jgi:hypothetical protein
MCPDLNFQKKMDVLDLIINVLKEHEENLDKLADKFENVLNKLFSVENKISNLNETFAQFLFSKRTNSKYSNQVTLTECKGWTEFKDRSAGAHTVAFEVEENVFTVNSSLGDVVYRYSEFLPELKIQVEEGHKQYVVKKMVFDSPGDLYPIFERQLKCGLEIFVKGSRSNLSDKERLLHLTYHVDPILAKHWLSDELNVPEENIIEGKLLHPSL